MRRTNGSRPAIRQRARKRPADVRREEILAAAVRVFANTPYRAAGTALIAREAGIAEPTLYRHFDSKRELYLAALERSGAAICDAWEGIVARAPDPATALHEIGHWYLNNILTDPDLLRLRYRAVGEAEDEEIRAALRGGYERAIAIVAGVVGRGQAQGQFARAVDPQGAASLFVGLGQVLDLAVLTGLPVPADHAHVKDESHDLFSHLPDDAGAGEAGSAAPLDMFGTFTRALHPHPP
jgi:AcrR family transcriptional regulator